MNDVTGHVSIGSCGLQLLTVTKQTTVTSTTYVLSVT